MVCGWTLSHSATPRKVADEIRRVVRTGGIVAIGVEYSTMTLATRFSCSAIRFRIRADASTPPRTSRNSSVEQKTIYFEHDAPNRISHTANQLDPRVSNVAVIFQAV